MSERQFQDMILELCRWLGLKVYHVVRSDRGVVTSKGYPDLTIVGPGGIVFAELKSEKGKLTDAQRGWLGALQDHARCYVWRPSDWEHVQIVLKEIAR